MHFVWFSMWDGFLTIRLRIPPSSLRDSGGIRRLVVRKIHLTWKTIQNAYLLAYFRICPCWEQFWDKSISKGFIVFNFVQWLTIIDAFWSIKHARKCILYGFPCKMDFSPLVTIYPTLVANDSSGIRRLVRKMHIFIIVRQPSIGVSLGHPVCIWQHFRCLWGNLH